MWLSALSMFGFLSLALVKRVSELRVAKESSEQVLHGRGYQVGDLPMLSQAGIRSGYTAVLVFALYIHGEEVKALYITPQTLWFVCPLMFYWLSRVWLLTHRGQMHDDPVGVRGARSISYVVGAWRWASSIWRGEDVQRACPPADRPKVRTQVTSWARIPGRGKRMRRSSGGIIHFRRPMDLTALPHGSGRSYGDSV